MSETTRPVPQDTFTFWRALELARKCWLPLLVAIVLIFLPTIAVTIVSWHGADAATAAQAAFLAEHAPDVDDILTLRKAQKAAEKAADEAYKPYRYVCLGIRLLGWIYTPWLTIGLFKGLLTALRGGTCTLRCLISARSRWKTALWLFFLTSLCTGAANIAGTLLTSGLSWVLGLIGSIIGAVIYVILMYWVTLHLLLTESHLADDTDEVLSATDCIRYSWQDMKNFSLFAALCVLWPLLLTVEVFPFILKFVPSAPVLDVVWLVVQMACFALIYAACAGIYDEIRRAPDASAADGASPDGLARARALAAGKEYPAE